jgi:hypothetical protein
VFDHSVVVSNRQPISSGGWSPPPLFDSSTDSYTLDGDSMIITYDPSAGPFEAGSSDGIVSEPAGVATWTSSGSAGGVSYANGSLTGSISVPSVTMDSPTTPPTTPTYVRGTLESSVFGVSVSGNFSPGSALTVSPIGDPAAGEAIAAASSAGRLIALYDIGVVGSYVGDLTVTIPVGQEYNEKDAAIIHHKADGTDETVDMTVADGKVAGTFSSLSPFGVALKEAPETPQNPYVPGTGVTYIPPVGNAAGGNTTPLNKKTESDADESTDKNPITGDNTDEDSITGDSTDADTTGANPAASDGIDEAIVASSDTGAETTGATPAGDAGSNADVTNTIGDQDTPLAQGKADTTEKTKNTGGVPLWLLIVIIAAAVATITTVVIRRRNGNKEKRPA